MSLVSLDLPTLDVFMCKRGWGKGNLPVDSGGHSRVKHTEIESTAAGLRWTRGLGIYLLLKQVSKPNAEK